MDEVRPRAGVDYPGTWPSFEKWFPDDDACREYLARVRWPDGFVCPGCGGADVWRTGRGLWMCRGCGRQTSVTAGTIFHRSRYPLRTWFAAMWFVCSQKNGVSALGLQRAIGFGSYETAWAWMHKLRRAMVRPDRDLLGGDGVSVEVDQTFHGGPQNARSRRYANKHEIVIGIERQHPVGFGRVRLAHIDTTDRKRELFAFCQHNLAHGTILYTDGDSIYPKIAKKLQITHVPTAMVHSPDPAHEVLPGVHLVASLLKRWLAGTLHDGISNQHLGYYLDEFTFRFNRRTSRSRGLLWYRLVQQAVNTNPHPLAVLQHKM
jgi:transposase-like protein